MDILITGAAGFVGRGMVEFFVQKGWSVIAVDRNPRPEEFKSEHIIYIQADTSAEGKWQDEAGRVDAVVNLAGKNIFSRWTEKYKQELFDSRIKTTSNLVDAMKGAKPAVFCSTSAVGYYGDKGDQIVDESTPAGDDFLAELSIKWEETALKAQDKGVRVILPRFSLIMAKHGGALAAMLPSFKFFAGGPLGDGSHWMPWIHMHDLLRAMDFVIENQEISGPVNFAAPNPVQNREFAKALGRALNRPAFFRVPKFVLTLALGELGNMMLNSQRAVPEKLEQAGFTFTYPDIESAFSAEF
jgi:uncharacterized protein (TIGR01777 family)